MTFTGRSRTVPHATFYERLSMEIWHKCCRTVLYNVAWLDYDKNMGKESCCRQARLAGKVQCSRYGKLGIGFSAITAQLKDGIVNEAI
jgi:hypothetical protein